MTPATYEHTTAVEYAAGYNEGFLEGEWLIHDQRSSLYAAVLADLQEHARHAAFPYSRAYALGQLRGFRHAAWGIR